MRSATVRRDTKETRISGTLKIEGHGKYEISTGIRFFDHMLELFAKHGAFDLSLRAEGDDCLCEPVPDAEIHFVFHPAKRVFDPARVRLPAVPRSRASARNRWGD